MAETKKLKIVAVRPFLYQSKRVEIGEVVELPESQAMDVLGTTRALLATPENMAVAKSAAKAAEAQPAPQPTAKK